MISKSKIKTEQARILYQQSPILLVTLVVLAMVILYSFREHDSVDSLVYWSLLVVVISVVRGLLIKAFNARLEALGDPAPWLNAFAFSAFVSGAVWGGLLIRIIEPSFNHEVILVSFVLSGMAAGCLVPLSSYVPAFLSFTLATLIPLFTYLFNQGDEHTLVMSLMVVFYMLALVGFSFLVNRNILDSIYLRFENDELLENVKIEKERAEKANIDKSRFLAATSHDLRQPLYALDLYLGALEGVLDKKEQLELLGKVNSSSQALSQLLNAIMDVSKLDSGGVEINAKVFSLKNLLIMICNEFEQQAEKKGIIIEQKLADVVINTDPVLLSRIVRNLLSNAIKHNAHCKVSLVMALDKDIVTVFIQDNGKGIAATELDNIFSEFYQLDNPERDRTKGLGLGLAIVRRLSLLLSIPVKVESEVNKGSKFSLLIPVINDKAIEVESEQAIEINDLSDLFIIVIDDESAVRDAVRTLLRSWGCEILVDGSQASLLKELQQNSYPAPDLIISDYRLRDNKTGVQAIEAVREHFKLPLPALVITGDASASITEEVIDASSTLMLKPVGSVALRDKIQELVRVKSPKYHGL